MPIARRIGSPELTIVANWREKSATCLSLTFLPPNSICPIPLFWRVTSSGVSPCSRRRARTRASLSATSDPVVMFPVRSRTLYWKVSAISASHQHAARRAPVGADGRVVAVGDRAARGGAAHEPLELLRVVTSLEGDLLRDAARFGVLRERHVHRLHPVAASRLHRRVDLVGLAFPDQVADRGGADQDLDRGDPSMAVGRGDELLRDHALEGGRQLHPHLLLLVGWEHVDDAVDRLWGVLCVQGREDEVTGLGRRDRG